MRTVFSVILSAALMAGVVAAQTQPKPAPPTAAEKTLLGTWEGTWTGGSSGTVIFTFTRGADGKMGGSANPHPSDGDAYTTAFTSVVIAGDKVTMKMGTPDGTAEITVQATFTASDIKGTYAVKATGDGSEVESGAVVAKKKA